MHDVIILGGGAAGTFAAISAKMTRPEASVVVLEKSAVLLAKVRVSGGGRCNVTHNCFEPAELVKSYPRGERELIAPFYRFQPAHIVAWFEARGVFLKSEKDGRMFPITDRSETIVEALLNEAKVLGVEIYLRQRVVGVEKREDGFAVEVKEGQKWLCQKLILATGSSGEGHAYAERLGHSIQKPVPSLFTFNVPDSPLKELSGIAVNPVEVTVVEAGLMYKGPLLITHFGFSGPAVLKLSAWGARFLHEKEYRAEIEINWLPQWSQEEVVQELLRLKGAMPARTLVSENVFGLPKNLWKSLLGERGEKRMNDLSKGEIQGLGAKLHGDRYWTDGKTTNKEEFVTCGGVTLKEVHFKTMESKICPGLYFAGEILDIDGITGGFNFQNAWTTGYIAGSSAV